MTKVRTLIGIAVPRVRNDVAAAAALHVELIAVCLSPEQLLEKVDATIDLILVDVPFLSALMRRWRGVGHFKVPQRRNAAVILTLADDELRDALAFLHVCNGILFWQHDLDKIGRLATIMREGYCSVPPELLPDLISDRVRIGLIDRLVPMERTTLQLLGQALSNRAIARTLNVPEPAAKSLVRAVLTKLRLKNRTEAAIFAVRWLDCITAEPAPAKLTVPEKQLVS